MHQNDPNMLVANVIRPSVPTPRPDLRTRAPAPRGDCNILESLSLPFLPFANSDEGAEMNPESSRSGRRLNHRRPSASARLRAFGVGRSVRGTCNASAVNHDRQTSSGRWRSVGASYTVSWPSFFVRLNLRAEHEPEKLGSKSDKVEHAPPHVVLDRRLHTRVVAGIAELERR